MEKNQNNQWIIVVFKWHQHANELNKGKTFNFHVMHNINFTEKYGFGV